MNWKSFFEIQRKLDEAIRQNHDLQHENLITRKILAFQVELGELANETRCFKYWSLKDPSAHSVITEEYVDGLHFLLSLGLELDSLFESIEAETGMNDLCDQFQIVYRLSAQFDVKRNAVTYKNLFSAFLALGRRLNLSDQEIENAYMQKNQVNHQRQEQGY